ncbi:MAG TPA: hypothetical protein QGF35_08165 [Dehalococcoidia bacterium]|jgi:hypothetical protein|nr:hypothetical protein [Dehalococcoidia bacterium]
MRATLFLLVPVAWGLVWILIRIAMTARVASQKERTKTVEGRWRDPGEPAPIRLNEDDPPCGRHGVHLFLKTFGGERNCRHCAAVAQEQKMAEREAAVHEAERQVQQDNGDSTA